MRMSVQQIQVLGADALLLYLIAAIQEVAQGSVRRIRYFERPRERLRERPRLRLEPQSEELFRLPKKKVQSTHTQESVIWSRAAASDPGADAAILYFIAAIQEVAQGLTKARLPR